MSLHQKVDGVWVQAQRPYVKKNGIWTAGAEAYVKRSGAWVRAYEYDVTPPAPPQITLQLVDDYDTIKGKKTLMTRWIKVGVKMPGTTNNADVRLVRVLTTYPAGPNGKAPTSATGGQYTSKPDNTYPTEPWSEWRYNAYGPHKDTSVVYYKQWPPNAEAGTIIKGDMRYYFGAWTLDDAEHWSVATQAWIDVPKTGVEEAKIVTKEARFQANATGSWTGGKFQSGVLKQQGSPASTGLWFYGNQITSSVGASSGKITIKSAQIWFKRKETDSGNQTANVYLYWHDVGTVGGLGGSAPTPHNTVKIGTLVKGEGKWFSLPDGFLDDLNKNIKGMGLQKKDPNKAEAQPSDFSTIQSISDNIRSGELHVVWEEEL